MAKSRSRKKKGAGFDWRAAGTVVLRVLAVALLVVVGLGLTIGVDKVRARASDVLAAGPGLETGEGLRVTFDWPMLPGGGGTWLSQEDQAVLVRDARFAAGEAGPLSVDPVRRVSRVLGSTGWFESDPRVRAESVEHLHVSGEWRRPAAVVRWRYADERGGRDILISDRAMRMPVEWEAAPLTPGGEAGLPVILGCSQAPPRDSTLGTRYSSPWPGQDIRAGLSLLKVLNTAGLLGEILGVDVGGHWRGGPLEIVSKDGGRIVWGSAPDEWAEGEPSVAERVNRLRGLLERTGRIDGGERRIEIHREHVEIDRSVGALNDAGGDD